MKTVYVISGLGADHRIFHSVDFGSHRVVPLPWLQPYRNETIEAYAKRMADGIRDENPVLIGLSFGGMMSMEIAKHKRFEKIILISSSKTKNELPALYRLVGALGLHRILSMRLIKGAKNIVARLFSPRSPGEKQLIDEMLYETDPDLLKWSVAKIVRWKNTAIPGNTFHIHGTKDHVLPFRNVSCDKAVENAGHVMVLNRSGEISEWLQTVI